MRIHNPTHPCSCTVTHSGDSESITYCTVHAAAPDLLAACEELLRVSDKYADEMRAIGRGHMELGARAPSMSAAGLARAAIARARMGTP